MADIGLIFGITFFKCAWTSHGDSRDSCYLKKKTENLIYITLASKVRTYLVLYHFNASVADLTSRVQSFTEKISSKLFKKSKERLSSD